MNHDICVRPENDLKDVNCIMNVIKAMRECVRKDYRVISTLPQRIHLSEIKLEGYVISITCYVEAQSMTSFYNARESLLEDFTNICAENGVLIVIKEIELTF